MRCGGSGFVVSEVEVDTQFAAHDRVVAGLESGDGGVDGQVVVADGSGGEGGGFDGVVASLEEDVGEAAVVAVA
ncbi:hypothetical protein [Candidatus Poriferisodalis sp.]|uniref:hypothetical protein n=1 Tax=Candidatus Poriferisodalis sp. TaxID=3101277 RepID=UPI003B5A33B7